MWCSRESVSRTVTLKSGKKKTVTSIASTHTLLDGRVSDTDLGSSRCVAATSAGLFTSKRSGQSMGRRPCPAEKKTLFRCQAQDGLVVAATRINRARYLKTKEKFGSLRGWPPYAINIPRRDPLLRMAKSLWPPVKVPSTARIPARAGTTLVAGLPDKDITSVAYDGSHKRLLATSGQTGVVFESAGHGGNTWQRGPVFRFPAPPHQRGARTLRRSYSI